MFIFRPPFILTFGPNPSFDFGDNISGKTGRQHVLNVFMALYLFIVAR